MAGTGSMRSRLLGTAAVLAMGLPVAAWAETGASLMLRPFAPDTTMDLTADVAVFAQTDNADTSARHTQLTIQEISARYELTLDASAPPGRRDLPVSPVVGYQHTYFHINSTEPRLPGQLFDQSVAIGATVYRTETFALLASVGIGYAGTTPYADSDAIYGKADVVARFTLDSQSMLDLALSYAGNRSIWPDIPLPGIAYVRTSADRSLRYSLGIPYSYVMWKPTQTLTLNMSWLPMYNFSASATQELYENLAIYADFSSRTDAFQYTDTRGDRLLFEQRRLEGGVIFKPSGHVSLTAAVGYAFSQEFSLGYDSRDDNGFVKLDPAPYVRFGVEVGF